MRWWLPCLLALFATAAAADQITLDLAGESAFAEADVVQVDLGGREAALRGNALLRVGERSFRADVIVVDLTDLDAPLIRASGNVVAEDPLQGRVELDYLRYRLGIDEGELRGARLRLPISTEPPLEQLLRPDERPQALLVEAERATRRGTLFTAEGARLSLLNEHPPNVRILAGELTVETGSGLFDILQAVEAKDLRLQLYGTTLVGLPSLRVVADRVYLPRIGYNDTAGFYAAGNVTLALPGDNRILVEPVLGTRNGISGAASLIADTSIGEFRLVGSRRERELLSRAPWSVEVSRVPELRWDSRRFAPAPRSQLAATAGYGLYDELDRVDSWRHFARVDYRQTLYRGATSSVGIDAGGWYSGYDTGQTYAWLRGGLHFEKAFGYRFYIGSAFQSHAITGSTPFLFDRIMLPTVVTTDTRLRVSRHFLLESEIEYDVGRTEIRRQSYGIAYRDGLVEYGVGIAGPPYWSFEVNARLLGF